MSPVRSLHARAFVTAMASAACFCLLMGIGHWHSGDHVKFICYLTAALLASSLKVTLPGIEGTLSVNFLFTLIGVLELSLPETLLIGLNATVAQLFWKSAKRPRLIHVIFNLSQVTVSSAAAYGVYQAVAAHVLHAPGSLALLAAAVTHFACNTVAMSTIIGITEKKSVFAVWNESYKWSFPYYMVGAATAGLVHFLNGHIGWQSSLLVLPPIYLMYRSYRLYLEKLETEKRHAQQVSSLHLRTIETLALAIEAKDETTAEHLQRVRVYAMELAKDLGLNEDETEALRAASVLHDIGKLAVPEHIISKPGKLTPEEFEKMKIHPVVGAEILEQVNFPYPVAPIVRAHHEKWDGSGYPYGLVGKAIPIGARILSAVDCLDALASDRQYRKALPLAEAMAKVASESGTSFDPAVIEILGRRYIELEKLASEQPQIASPKLSTDIKIVRGAAPAAGFEEAEGIVPDQAAHFAGARERMEKVRREEQELFAICLSLRESLSAEDILSLAAVRLRHVVAHDAMAIFLMREDVLSAALVSGENFNLLSSLSIPLGEGLVGWVAENAKPIINGNPAVEPGYTPDEEPTSLLRSALALPLSGSHGVIGVLGLYRCAPDAFTKNDLDAVDALTVRVGLALERRCAPHSVKKAHA